MKNINIETFANVLMRLIMFLGIVFMSGFIIGAFVMLVWNWVVPGIFGLPEISYWQGWGLFVLSSFIFKGTISTTEKK